MKRSQTAGAAASFVAAALQLVVAQPARREYRVVFASARQLARQLDEAGRDGFVCEIVARPELRAGAPPVPGIVVVLGRPAGSANAAAAHRVVTGGGGGTDLGPSLDRSGAAGFRLCGIVLDEAAPVPSMVAVMSQPAGQAGSTWSYAGEVLSNYKNSLVRLNAAARDGFMPVAAEAVNNSRVPEGRNWLVITERPGSGRSPSEVAVRSSPGAEGLQRALNEQGGQGYRLDLVWKEGNDFVALMSRPLDGSKAPVSYAAEAADRSAIHALSRLYVADFPYLTTQRLIVSDRSAPASNDIVEDPLPAPGAPGYVGAAAMGVLGDHISRNRGFVPASVRVRRDDKGALILTTVITERRP
jgi:hypothetical protein